MLSFNPFECTIETKFSDPCVGNALLPRGVQFYFGRNNETEQVLQESYILVGLQGEDSFEIQLHTRQRQCPPAHLSIRGEAGVCGRSLEMISRFSKRPPL